MTKVLRDGQRGESERELLPTWFSGRRKHGEWNHVEETARVLLVDPRRVSVRGVGTSALGGAGMGRTWGERGVAEDWEAVDVIATRWARRGDGEDTRP